MISSKGMKLDKWPCSRGRYGLFLCVGVNVFLMGILDLAILAGSIPLQVRNPLRFFAAQTTYCCCITSLKIPNNTDHAYPFVMADDEKRSAKRSRFDQTEPEPKRSSRFDRRSRSPSSRSADVRRSRSPLGQRTPFSPGSEGKSTPLDPAAAAGKYRDLFRPREND